MPPDPDPTPSPTPSPTPDPAGDPFAGIQFPDKFKKDGKPDLGSFVASYGELETRFNTKTEELKKQIAAETLKARPEAPDKYNLPKLEGIDEKELSEHPMVQWWRNEAFEAGIPQDKFAKGVEQYVASLAPRDIPEAELVAALGDNFKARIAAVDAWATKTAQNETEMELLKQVATSPAGIQLLERFTGLAAPLRADDPASPQKTLALDDLRSMQQDPKYWDPVQRDPAFVKKVEDGYAKLYPPKRA